MKHAAHDALDQLEPLLVELRALPMLRERSRGVFYLKSQAFLHFHSDPAGLFADVRIDDQFQRFAVSARAGQRTLLKQVKALLT